MKFNIELIQPEHALLVMIFNRTEELAHDFHIGFSAAHVFPLSLVDCCRCVVLSECARGCAEDEKRKQYAFLVCIHGCLLLDCQNRSLCPSQQVQVANFGCTIKRWQRPQCSMIWHLRRPNRATSCFIG